MAEHPIPEGFTFDENSKLYYKQNVITLPNGAQVQDVIWFYPETGEYKNFKYPLRPAQTPPPQAQPQAQLQMQARPQYYAPPKKKSNAALIAVLVSVGVLMLGVLVFVGYRFLSGKSSFIGPGNLRDRIGVIDNTSAYSSTSSSNGQGASNNTASSSSTNRPQPVLSDKNDTSSDKNTGKADSVDNGKGSEQEPERETTGTSSSPATNDPYTPKGETHAPNGSYIGDIYGTYYLWSQTEEDLMLFGEYLAYFKIKKDGTYELYWQGGGDSVMCSGTYTVKPREDEMGDTHVYLLNASRGYDNATAEVIFSDAPDYPMFASSGFGYMGYDGPPYWFERVE